MEVDVRTTPKGYDQSRSLYERSVAESNESRVLSIGLDTAIDNLRSMALEGHISLIEASAALQDVSKLAILKGMRNAARDTFTDYNRVLSTATFARERLLAPILYSASGPQAIEARSRLSDGTEGAATELIAQYLDIMDTLDDDAYVDQIKQVRGVIQELTVASLMNFEQTSSRLCVTASTYDDLVMQTDLYEYYYDVSQTQGYRRDISVKSTLKQKIDEQSGAPDLIVVAAEEFGNLDLSVSELLVRRSKGAPGLSAEEMARLREAKNTVINIVKNQAVHRPYDALDPMFDEELEAQFIAA